MLKFASSVYFPFIFYILFVRCPTVAPSSRNIAGHLEPLGSHRRPEIATDVLTEIPSPDVFFRNYYKTRKPVVLKGAARKSRAFTFWTVDYLRENYGNVTVSIQSKSEADDYVPVGDRGVGLDSMESFLNTYKQSNKYVISQIPQEMEKDIYIPDCLSCSSLSRVIQEVHLFISSKGGQTLLHRDPYTNIHCVFNGTKDWILIHPKQTANLYMSTESSYEWGGFSEVDVDKVDLHVHPLVKTIQYSKVTVDKGDCIFMPGGYWHQVRSWGEINAAVSIWMSRYETDVIAHCNNQLQLTTMDKYPIIWRYSGQGPLTQGHMDIYLLQYTLIVWADAQGIVNLKSFTERFFILSKENKRRKAMIQDIKRRKKLFIKYLGSSMDSQCAVDKVKNLTVADLKTLVEYIHPNEITNSNEQEYSYVKADTLRYTILGCLSESGVFNATMFRQLYCEELGGTEERATQLISKIGELSENVLTREELDTALPDILEKYYNVIPHDPEAERELYRFLTSRGSIARHDEL